MKKSADKKRIRTEKSMDDFLKKGLKECRNRFPYSLSKGFEKNFLDKLENVELDETNPRGHFPLGRLGINSRVFSEYKFTFLRKLRNRSGGLGLGRLGSLAAFVFIAFLSIFFFDSPLVNMFNNKGALSKLDVDLSNIAEVRRRSKKIYSPLSGSINKPGFIRRVTFNKNIGGKVFERSRSQGKIVQSGEVKNLPLLSNSRKDLFYELFIRQNLRNHPLRNHFYQGARANTNSGSIQKSKLANRDNFNDFNSRMNQRRSGQNLNFMPVLYPMGSVNSK